MQRESLNFQKNLLIVIVVLFWFAQYVYVPFQTPYLMGMQVSSSMVGVIIGIYGFSQMALRMPVGIMADKNGRHKLFIIIGAASSALASVFRIMLSPEVGFLIGNILSGLASAMWISFMVLYASYFAKENLQKAMGLIIAANNIGILGGFAVSTLLYNYLGMDFLCFLSICSGVPAILLSFLIKETKIERDTPKISSLIKVYVDKRLIFFAVIALVQQGILMATCMSFTTQIAHEIRATSVQIGLLSIVYIISAVVFSYFAASVFAQRYSSKFWISSVMFCLALYCFIVPNVTSPDLLIFVQILAGMSTGIVFSFCTSEGMKNVSVEKRSTAMGYYQAIYAVGMTAVPMFSGIVSESRGLGTAFYIEGVFAILAAVAVIRFFHKKVKL